MGQLIVVGMADLNIARGDSRLITYGLGSCVGITLHDPVLHIAGMVHIMLPSSQTATDASNKAKFADTGFLALLSAMLRAGANRTTLVAKLAGGAHMFQHTKAQDVIKVGQRNAEACQNILRQARIPIAAQATGGNFGRTIELDAYTGSLLIKTIGHGQTTI